jgi:hypothetical protein
MYTLAALAAFVLVTIGFVAMIGGNVGPGALLIVVGCAVAASTRLSKS